MIYILDLLGTVAFAAYGANLAQRKEFDIFGITVTATLSALGGGILRDTMLNKIPSSITDLNYLWAVLIGISIAILIAKQSLSIPKPFLTIDAIGLATFAFIGAHAASMANMNIFGITICSTISAIGGGIMRDISMQETPLVFKYDLYATPAVLLGLLFPIMQIENPETTRGYLLILGTFLFRLLAIHYNWQLWKPKIKSP